MKIYRVSEHHFFGTPEHRIVGLFAFNTKKAAFIFSDKCNSLQDKPNYIIFRVTEESIFDSAEDVFKTFGPIKFVSSKVFQPSVN